MKHRARVAARRQATLAAAIVEYFRHSGAEVRAECLGRPGGKRFIAIVDSEPLKRFRYSHIVEVSLSNHVYKACGIELERVYWRFPVRMPAQTPVAEGEVAAPVPPTEQNEDDYINDRLLRLKTEAEYKVSPASWEQFEEAVHIESDKHLH